jgi:LPXTG-site transpeptidase (sortase) family protein
MVSGLSMVALFAIGMWQGYAEQQRLNLEWRQVMARTPVANYGSHPVDPALKRPIDGIDFAIRVPSLGYFAAVREGVDQTILYTGPGHYPETRWPGDPGMVGVAAHNVFWIDFPRLKRGDQIDVETRYGRFTYRVMSTRIVDPDDRTVLVPDAEGRHLTLTTCWPVWAGSLATQRYIIFTDQVRPKPPPDSAAP